MDSTAASLCRDNGISILVFNLEDPEKHPLSVFLSKINSGEIGLAFAVATIYMVPPILVFLYGEDYLVEGITYQGGIKRI